MHLALITFLAAWPSLDGDYLAGSEAVVSIRGDRWQLWMPRPYLAHVDVRFERRCHDRYPQCEMGTLHFPPDSGLARCEYQLVEGNLWLSPGCVGAVEPGIGSRIAGPAGLRFTSRAPATGLWKSLASSETWMELRTTLEPADDRIERHAWSPGPSAVSWVPGVAGFAHVDDGTLLRRVTEPELERVARNRFERFRLQPSADPPVMTLAAALREHLVTVRATSWRGTQLNFELSGPRAMVIWVPAGTVFAARSPEGPRVRITLGHAPPVDPDRRTEVTFTTEPLSVRGFETQDVWELDPVP